MVNTPFFPDGLTLTQTTPIVFKTPAEFDTAGSCMIELAHVCKSVLVMEIS